PFCGLFFAESGSRMPPEVFSCAAERRTTIRSPSGLTCIAISRDDRRKVPEYPWLACSKFHAPDGWRCKLFCPQVLKPCRAPGPFRFPAKLAGRGKEPLSEWQPRGNSVGRVGTGTSVVKRGLKDWTRICRLIEVRPLQDQCRSARGTYCVTKHKENDLM